MPGRVVLAHEPPFTLGSLRVEPALRQVRSGERSQILEPRVMQALVALARAGGAIVTRDELIHCCWEGRIVGDDSINRALSRIRRLAADLGGGSFAVETIPRVGYRLRQAASGEEGIADAPPPAIAAAAPAGRRRFLVAAAAVTTAAALGGGAVALLLPRPAGRPAPHPAAVDLYQRAVELRQNGGPSDNRQAIAYLREAVRLSPEYAEAWGALALAYRYAITNEAPERVSGFEERLREAAANAERYGPSNADAAFALVAGQPFFGRWQEWEAVYGSLIRRHPQHAGGYFMLGGLLMDVGRWSDAVSALRLAKARNSSSAVLRYKLAVSLWSAGRISAAEDEIDEAIRLWPQHGAIWQTKIKLLALTGRPREALAFASNPAAMPLDEDDAPDPLGQRLYLTALATGASADRERALEWTLDHARGLQHERLNAALKAVTLGRPDIALEMLEGLYLGTGAWAVEGSRAWLVSHPLFQPHARPLWGDRRFDRILDAVGLERYWQSTRTLPDYRR